MTASSNPMRAEVVLPCTELSTTVATLTESLGFRIETVLPADSPQVIVVSGHGLRLRCEAVPNAAPSSSVRIRVHCDRAREPMPLPGSVHWIDFAPLETPVIVPAVPKQQAPIHSPLAAAEWVEGDADGLAAIMNEGFEEGDDTFATALLYDRNANWAEWIDARLESTPGTVFIAVGAGHLAGSKSVQDYLAAREIEAERVQ